MNRHFSGIPKIVSLAITSLVIVFTDSVYADQMNPPSTDSGRLEYLDLRLTPDILNPLNDENKADFSGTWVFDPEASDDPEEVLSTAGDHTKKAKNKGSRDAGERRPGGRPDGKGAGGKGPGGRRKGEDGSSSRHQNMQALIQELKSTQLVINHQEPAFEIYSRSTGTRVIYTDYRYSSVSAIGGSHQVTATAGWEDDVLVVNFDTGVDKSVVQRFKLLSEPDRLQRITVLSPEHPGEKVVTIRQVFQLKK